MSFFDPYDLITNDRQDKEPESTLAALYRGGPEISLPPKTKDDSFYVRAKNWEWEWFASGALVSSMIVAAFVGNAGIVLLCLLAIIIKLLTSDILFNKNETHITESDLELDLEEYTLEAEFRKLEIEALLKDLKERL